MELFRKTTAIKLRSHLGKYLFADADGETVRQSRNASSRSAVWMVELCSKPDRIKLKNYGTGLYLTASDAPFLLGVTGRKAVQSVAVHENAAYSEWEPVRDGFQMKFKTREGNYLRANGGTPPWRNSVTHDVPLTGGTYKWILWDVEAVDFSDEIRSFGQDFSPASSFSAASQDSPASRSPSKDFCDWTPNVSMKQTGMDLFAGAKAVRLKSHHDKYLLAEEDEESVTQDRNGSSKNARWTVEPVDNADNIIRLKSCYGKYLTASNQPFLLGMTGRKVLQTLPRRLDSSVEWEPVREGSQVRLKTQYGNFLRANGGVPPWRNSLTHDVPHRTATQDWVLWHVDIVEISEHSIGHLGPTKPVGQAASAATPDEMQQVGHSDSFSSESSWPSLGSDRFHTFSRQESIESATHSPPKPNGRLIYYHIADENGEIDETVEGYSLTFKGNTVEELTLRLEEESGLRDIVVCNHSPLNGKLHPLRLQLPPNNATMHVVVVQSSSITTQDFARNLMIK